MDEPIHPFWIRMVDGLAVPEVQLNHSPNDNPKQEPDLQRNLQHPFVVHNEGNSNHDSRQWCNLLFRWS